MEKRECLYVGADDSNHAGDTKGEIIVATFSFDRNDSLVRNFPNTRDLKAVAEWLKLPERDYLFSLLTSDSYRHSGQNLIEVIPYLVDFYLDKNSVQVGNLNVYLDGRLDGGARDHIKKHFMEKHGIENVVVDNFIKKTKNTKGRIEKHPHCPTLVYNADVIANSLYRQNTAEQLFTHGKFIPLK
ncbi:MAG: hypothetical protein AABX91_01645 [Nanoarchaeota archaeon]